MTTAKNVMKMIKDNDVKYVDFRFTDPRGKWQHVTFDVTMIEEDTFAEGQMFDGSSIAGWKAINESDMCLMLDPVTATIDPFFAETTLILVCDVLEPTTGEPYNRDPRGMAKKAEAMVKSMGIGDTVFFGPEAEFFVFDDVRYQTTPYNTGFKLDSSELPINSDTEYEGGNLGHRIRTKAGYFPVPPQDSVQDMRSEMLGAMAKMGVKVEKHHHEVASAQHELGMKFDTLTLMADQMQIYKYCIHQVAHIYGKTATFMPKPVYGDNGSGMHCHQSIWKGGKPVFAGNKSGEHPYSIESVRPGSRRRELAFFSDAVISNVPGTNFMITAADCVPLAFADRSRNAIGAAHAGWRGTALSIASEVVHAMLRAFQSEPQDLIVGIGPSVGPCCYAVDEGVVRSFAENGHNPVIEKRGGKTYLDLWTTNALQLASAGVSAESIEICRICTSCNVQHYFSHRAEAGRTGRFALCIGL